MPNNSEPTQGRYGLNPDWESVAHHEDWAAQNGKTGIPSVDAANKINSKLVTDSVASSFNRPFFEKFKENFEANTDQHNKIGLIFIDLNDFKIVNDEEGHNKGDEILRKMVAFLRQHFRRNDELIDLTDHNNKTHNSISRYGGDEFVIICHNNNNDKNFEDNLILKMQEIVKSLDAPVKFSYGVAVFNKDLDASLDDTINRADENMFSYKEKNKRRGWKRKIKTIIKILMNP